MTTRKKNERYYKGEWHTVVDHDSATNRYRLRSKSEPFTEVWVDAAEVDPRPISAGSPGRKMPSRRRGQPPR